MRVEIQHVPAEKGHPTEPVGVLEDTDLQPLPSEVVGYGGRQYQVLQRSWSVAANGEVELGLLVNQIAGPARIRVASPGQIAQLGRIK